MKLMTLFNKIFKFQEKKPVLGEIAITYDAVFKELKLQPYFPDKLLTRKKFDIFNEMILDPEIDSAINTLKTIRLASGWEIVPASDNEQDKEIADFVLWNLENVENSFEDDLREIMGAVEMGISINELVWEEIKDSPKWNGKIRLKSIKSKNPKYFNIWTDEFDNIKENGIINLSPNAFGEEYPVEKFVIYSFNKRYENIFGTSRIRTLYDLWFLKQVVTKAYGIFIEKYGLPIPVIKHPPIDEETRKGLLQALNQIRLETGMLIPQELELIFSEPSRGSADVYIRALEYINNQIRKTILGQTLTAESGGVGSYALGQVHFDILLFYEEELGKDVAKKAVNNQIIKRLVDYNFNNVINYPQFRFKPLIQRDIEKIIEKYYQGVSAGIIKPIPEDEILIREWLSLPKREVEKITETKEKEQGNMHYIKFKEKIFSGVKRRSFTKYEEQTDFVEILDFIEDMVANFTVKVTEILKESVDNLIEDIAKKKIVEEKNMSAIEKLHLKYVGDIKSLFQSMLEQAFKKGMSSARQEIINKKRVFKGREYIKFQEIELRTITPEEAFEFFKQKSFYMAGVERDRILKEVKQVLYNAIKTGATLSDTIEEINKVLEPYFVRGLVGEEALKSYRLETVIRTNLNEAFNEGRKSFFQAPELEGYVVAYQYSAILDDRVRPNHAILDGKIFSVTNPVIKRITPPNGFNCRCILVPVTEDEEWEESKLPAGWKPDEGFNKPGE